MADAAHSIDREGLQGVAAPAAVSAVWYHPGPLEEAMVDAIRRTLNHFFPPYGHVVEEIRRLGKLDRGWNTYRAGRINDEAQEQAIAFVGSLTTLAERVPAPKVVPTPNGGVGLHWLTRDRDVEVVFFAKGGEYTIAQRGSAEIIDAGPISQVDLLKDVVRDHVR
jgi:hypothetical protein